MKINKHLSVIIFLIVCSPAFGQDQQSTEVKRISISDFYFQTGAENYNTGTSADFKVLAPQSVLLNYTKIDVTESPSYALRDASNLMLSLMLGLKFSDKQKSTFRTNPQVRLGISYIYGSTLTASSYREDVKTYDTLTSDNTGQKFYLDSVNGHYTSADYYGSQLRIATSIIFRTNPEKRWSIYTGIGASAGFSINANTYIYYDEYHGMRTRDENVNNSSSYRRGYYSYDKRKTEKFNNKTNFSASTYIPVGIDFRIGKKGEYRKRTHLYYELRPGINITSIPELRTIANVSLQHDLGLRISL